VKETSTWPVVLVGTHVDSEDSRLVTFEEAAKIARRYDAKYYEIDSRNGDSVNEVFDACVDAVRARFNEK
jgi:Mg-chelatase subunit ChlD